MKTYLFQANTQFMQKQPQYPPKKMKIITWFFIFTQFQHNRRRSMLPQTTYTIENIYFDRMNVSDEKIDTNKYWQTTEMMRGFCENLMRYLLCAISSCMWKFNKSDYHESGLFSNHITKCRRKYIYMLFKTINYTKCTFLIAFSCKAGYCNSRLFCSRHKFLRGF